MIPMLSAIGIVIRTSMLLVCVSVVAFSLRRASASVRHALWAIGLLAVLVFPVVSDILPKWDVPVLPAGSALTRYDTSPLTEEAPPDVPHMSLPTSKSDTVRPALASYSPAPSTLLQLPRWSWVEILSLVWMLGSVLSVSRWIHSLWQLRKLTKGSRAAAGSDLELRFLEAQKTIGCSGRIQLRICDDAVSPMTWGIFGHVILLPAAAIRWPHDRQTLVLAHELAHIRRHDAIGQMLGQVVRSLYWFNPLVWYAVYRLHAERERACDDYVLRTGAVDADYAEHLLQITRGLNSGVASAAVLMVHPSQLKVRLVAILDSRIARSRASRFAASALVMMIGVVTLSIAAVQVTEISAMVLPAVAKPLGVPLGSLIRSPETPYVAAMMEPAVESQQRAVQAVDPQLAFIRQYCLSCHNRDDRIANVIFEDPGNDIAHVADNRALWEKVAHRLRLGIHPSAGAGVPLPPAELRVSVAQFLETALDTDARTYVPAIVPHRLNRTEYANAIRDLLDLEIEPGQLLPMDDSSSGFDTIAATLEDSPKFREAYIGVAPIVSRLAVQAPPSSSSFQRIFPCLPSGAFVLGLGNIIDDPACFRKIITSLTENAFRGSASTADIEGLIAAGNTAGYGIDPKVMATLSQILASPKFLYRTEEAPAAVKPGEAYRISDLALASRLSFFLWSTSPDAELIALAKQGKLHDPAVLEQQTLRMLQDYRAEALSLNFARQWLGMWSFQSLKPSQAFFPEFDASLRQAMMREMEMFFDSVVREDRGVTDLLTANYTFVNNRLARFYGIPNVSGSQFRRVVLMDTLDVRRGILGKAAFLATANNSNYNNRTSPTERGYWVITRLLGIHPPDPPPSESSLRQRSNDPNVVEPPVRQMLEDLKNSYPNSNACISCHRYTDPIGYALENFNMIGMWRDTDGGLSIDAKEMLIDGTTVNGPVELRNWLVSRSDIFIQTLTQKLLTYGLGRGMDSRDMPLVRSIDREAAKNGNRFSSIVLGIVKSDTFQMNSK